MKNKKYYTVRTVKNLIKKNKKYYTVRTVKNLIRKQKILHCRNSSKI